MKLFPNLTEIVKLKGPGLRVLLCTALNHDQEELASAFPRCFSDIRGLPPPRLAASLVRGVAAELARRAFPRDPAWAAYAEATGWHEALEHLSIPHIVWDEEQGTLPSSIWHRVSGQLPRAGLRVHLGGVEHRLVSYWAHDAALDLPMHYAGDAIIRVVERKVIDFKA